MRSVLDDRQSVYEYVMGVALVYLGYDLVSITPHGHNVEFVILCPKVDFDDLCSEYNSGSMQISDVRAFGKMYSHVSRLVRDARRDGGYTNPDFDQLLRDEALATS
jgi:hypothetical protein